MKLTITTEDVTAGAIGKIIDAVKKYYGTVKIDVESIKDAKDCSELKITLEHEEF